MKRARPRRRGPAQGHHVAWAGVAASPCPCWAGPAPADTWTFALVAGAAVTAAAASPAAADAAPRPVTASRARSSSWAPAASAGPTPDRHPRPEPPARRRGRSGVESARSVRASTCPVDGWLGVSAGARTADEPARPARQARAGCPPRPAPRGPRPGGPLARLQPSRSRLPGRRPARPARGHARLRRGAGGRRRPRRRDRARDATGSVPHAWPGVPAAADGGIETTAHPGRRRCGAGHTGAAGPRDVPAAAGRRRRCGARRGGGGTAEQVAAADAGSAPCSRRCRPTRPCRSSLADAGGQARLQLAGARGPAPGGGTWSGYLRSPSTRQTGLVQATDVMPTLLAALGVDAPPGAVGSAAHGRRAGTPAVDRLQRLHDLAAPAEALDPLVAPFFVGNLLAGVPAASAAPCSCGAGTAGASPHHQLRRRDRRDRDRRRPGPGGHVPGQPWPWWRAGSPGSALTLAVLACTVPLALVALLGPGGGRCSAAGAAGALTALVLTADVATGSQLSLTALIGGQPLVGGRFYGLSNPGFALFATGALLAAIALADPLVRAGRPGRAAAVVAVVGLVATAVDGLPGLGSDFGGPPAPAPRVRVPRAAGRRRAADLAPWPRRAGRTVAASWPWPSGDWLRPPASRTHLGRFVQTVLDGGGADVVFRKAEQNLAIVTSSPFQLVLPWSRSPSVSPARPQPLWAARAGACLRRRPGAAPGPRGARRAARGGLRRQRLGGGDPAGGGDAGAAGAAGGLAPGAPGAGAARAHRRTATTTASRTTGAA